MPRRAEAEDKHRGPVHREGEGSRANPPLPARGEMSVRVHRVATDGQERVIGSLPNPARVSDSARNQKRPTTRSWAATGARG